MKKAMTLVLSIASPFALRCRKASAHGDVVGLHDLVFCENSSKRIALFPEKIRGALLAIHNHEDQFDRGACLLDRIDRLHERLPAGGHVVDDDNAITGSEFAFDDLACSVTFDFRADKRALDA